MRSRSRRQTRIRLLSRLIAALLIAAGMLLALGLIAPTQTRYANSPLGAQRAIAQQYGVPIPSRVAEEIYRRLPEIPLENNYISQRTGAVDPEDTFLSRMIRYHTLIKGRSPISRFDWKLTLADYLGINEPMVPGSYPGAINLTTNPLEADTAVVNQFTRAQRDALVNTLVAFFNPSVLNPPPQLTPSGVSAETPQQNAPPVGRGSTQPLPLEPRPGDAQLLMP
ncbi:hypothetical protein HNI00_00850 [Thermoleptolyngbya oregonensis NK1-22]|uniref:Uncharacterized protein n=1 Tax=Thermoleptolyngbya oregonensis NK1-22 TaxID=2547457 RepID=A0AA96Y3L3_9CYAN|nr:hypothetical protein [Thermoleptolyngbya oregonensis]WOB41884.1 hypothetical protein HNI00_00850 [Thermoleptolyngbya oregonensis NK1-22]